MFSDDHNSRQPVRLDDVFASLSHQILQMFEDNYPEGLKRLFVIKGQFV